jgi:Rieske Fe-S protein
LPLLVACGNDAETADPPATGDGAESGTETTTASPDAPAAGADPLAGTADVPVGGGKILADQKVVLTQPADGEFKAFTAVCTHQGCTVNSVSDGIIHCPCHGSQFSIEDGSVVGGPAPKPLGAVEITVEGDQITRA